MLFTSFSYLFFLIYLLFFFLDICSGLHFFDFVEIGILSVISFVYFFITYSNVSARSVWFLSYNSLFGFLSVSFSSLSLFSSSSFSFGSVNHLLLSFYHSLFVLFFHRFSFLSCFSYFTFFFSDGIDFLYSSYRISSLWLFCVLMFCSFFVISTFSPVYSSFSRFLFSPLKSHFLLEVNAFFSVVFYVIGLFFFCLLGLTVWFSLFYDNYGIVREIFGCQWFWGETVCDIFSEWKSSSLVSIFDLSSSQLRLLTSVRPFLFDVNVLYCINLSSLDVIHSFGLPKFGIKIDVMPGVVTHASFFSVFPCLISLICSELCGAKHSQMYAELVFG